MKIKSPLYVSIMSVVVIGILGVSIGIIKMIFNNKQSLTHLTPFFIIIFAGVIFNCVYLVRIYKDFITLTDSSIIINHGFRKKVINLCNIESVHYNKNSMICYMADGSKNRIETAFIKKSDEMALYKFLEKNSIRITS